LDDNDNCFLRWQCIFGSCFSDFGNIVGPFYAALAFGGLIWTIHVQQRESTETREELAKAASAQGAQVKAARDSARLTAMTALINYYQPRTSDAFGGVVSSEAKRKVPEIVQKIEGLLTEIENEQASKE
jgi:hypothetical protein